MKLVDRFIAHLVALSILDVLLFLGAVVPGLLGYVGSESYEWTTLAVIQITGAIGIVLVPLTVISVKTRARFRRDS